MIKVFLKDWGGSMAFKELDLKISYNSSNDDLLSDFYINVLETTFKYDRIAGFFSSSILIGAMKGFYEIAKKKGKIRIIMSPKLSEEDIKLLSKTPNELQRELGDILLQEVEFSKDEFEKDCKKLLGYMLYNDLLEIKIALVKEENGKIFSFDQVQTLGLFHQKIGIFEDEQGNCISFSGSINETMSGWASNIEEFKVFKSWENSQSEYFKTDREKFELYWNNYAKNVEVIELPVAVKNEILKYRGDIAEIEQLALKNYKKTKTSKDLSLFFYQKEAVEKFLKNNCRLILEMATGTGKTRTAIGCINEILKKKQKTVIIISTPQNLLSQQWKADIELLKIETDETLIASGINSTWRKEIEKLIYTINNGVINSLIIYTTHVTSSKPDFIKTLKLLKDEVKIFFIGDEVHGLGAGKMRYSLDERYDYRLGLSATPERWFDDEGSQKLREYFGNDSFIFDIHAALTTINPITNRTFLTPYYYYPIRVELAENELEEYIEITQKISKLAFLKDTDDATPLTQLLNKRSEIIKNAVNKLDSLEKTLKNLKIIEDILIFTSPHSLDKIQDLMLKMDIIYNIITQNQGSKPEKKFGNISERAYIIKNFSEKNYKILLAIKCLDEGIDIPSAKVAILYSNTTNPREYIQRIGRVIRSSKDKNEAYIFDFIVAPSFSSYPSLKKYEKNIFEKELKRALYIAENSINQIEATKELLDIGEI